MAKSKTPGDALLRDLLVPHSDGGAVVQQHLFFRRLELQSFHAPPDKVIVPAPNQIFFVAASMGRGRKSSPGILEGLAPRELVALAHGGEKVVGPLPTVLVPVADANKEKIGHESSSTPKPPAPFLEEQASHPIVNVSGNFNLDVCQGSA
jgi:hypothetical protein